MKTINILLLSTLLLSTSILAKELTKAKESWKGSSSKADDTKKKDNSWKVSGTSETIGVYRYNSGKGANTDSNGNTVRQELGLKTKGNLGKGIAGVEARGRATDDEKVSKNKTELLYFRSYYTDKEFDVQVGDVGQTYNPLIFSGTVKGTTLTYKQELEKKQSITYSLIGGTQAGSWKELVEHKAVHRDAIAGDIRYQHNTAQMIAFTLSASQDRASNAVKSLTSNYNASEAVSLGLQVNWRFNRYLKLKGEVGYTDTDTITTDSKKRSKLASRMTLYTKPTKTINSNFKYERYDSGYNSMVGSSTQDRERLQNTSTWTISKALRSRMTLKGSRDNLEGQLGETQNIFDTMVAFTYRPEFMKRGDLGLRMQQVSRIGRGDDTTQQNIGIDFSNKLTSGLSYGITYDYTDLDNSDDSNSSNELQTVRGKLGWKTKYNEDNNFRASIKADISFYKEQTEDRKRYGGTVDAGWDYGSKFMLDMLITSKSTDRDLSVNTSYELYQLISQYKPFSDSSHILKLQLNRRDNNGGTSINSYEEDEAKLSYAFSF